VTEVIFVVFANPVAFKIVYLFILFEQIIQQKCVSKFFFCWKVVKFPENFFKRSSTLLQNTFCVTGPSWAKRWTGSWARRRKPLFRLPALAASSRRKRKNNHVSISKTFLAVVGDDDINHKRRFRKNKPSFMLHIRRPSFQRPALAVNQEKKGQENIYFSCFKYRMPPFQLLGLSMWKRRKEDGNKFFQAWHTRTAANLSDRLQEKNGKALKGGHFSCRPWQHPKEEKRTKNLL